MGKLSVEAKVGAFVVLCFLGLGVIATTLEPLKFKGETKYRYRFLFKNVAGLEKDAPVRIAGVTVGKVLSVGVTGDKAVVDVVFMKPVKLHSDAVARIETMGLMGEKFIEIYPGTPSAPVLPSGSVVQNTKVPASMDEVMTSLNELLEKFNSALMTSDGKNRLAVIMDRISELTENVNRTVSSINGVIEENRKDIRELVRSALALSSALREDLPEVLENVKTLSEQLSQMALENREDIRSAIVNLREAAEKAPQIAERVDSLAARLQSLLDQESVEDVRSTLKNLKETTAELKVLISKVNEGKGTVGKLFNDEKLYNNLSRTTEALGKLADKFERTKTFIGFRGDVNVKTGDSRGTFSLQLIPSDDHYYLFEIVGDSQGKVDRKKYYITYDSTVEEREEIETSYRTEFTIQYARMFNDRWLHEGGKFVLRGGLKESTGGFGLDYIYDDRFAVFSDIWDFGRKDKDGDDINPHLRVGLKYYLNKNWFVYGGGDELLYSKWRGFFLGAGVMFGDEDLKYLLGSMPGGIK